MATETYELIGSTTLTSATSSVAFTGYSGYKDLMLVAEYSASSATKVYANIRFNSGSNIIISYYFGSGTSVGWQSENQSTPIYLFPRSTQGPDNTQRALATIYVADANVTDKNKAFMMRNQLHTNQMNIATGVNQTTAAITTVEIYSTQGSFAIGSKFTIHGIAG